MVAGVVAFIFGILILSDPDIVGNVLWDTAGRQLPLFFAVALACIIPTSIGVAGVRKAHPNLPIIIYFYINVISVLTLMLLVTLPFIMREYLEKTIESRWMEISVIFPDSWQNYNGTEAVQAIDDLTTKEAGLIVLALLFVFISAFRLSVHRPF